MDAILHIGVWLMEIYPDGNVFQPYALLDFQVVIYSHFSSH